LDHSDSEPIATPVGSSFSGCVRAVRWSTPSRSLHTSRRARPSCTTAQRTRLASTRSSALPSEIALQRGARPTGVLDVRPIFSDYVRLFLTPGGKGRLAHVDDRWHSVDEVAEHLGVARDTVYRWIDHGALPAHRVGRLWKLKFSEVDAWVRSDGADEKNRANSKPRAPRRDPR